MSKPPHQVSTKSEIKQGAKVNVPVVAIYAADGAIPSDNPSTICARDVKRLQ